MLQGASITHLNIQHSGLGLLPVGACGPDGLTALVQLHMHGRRPQPHLGSTALTRHTQSHASQHIKGCATSARLETGCPAGQSAENMCGLAAAAAMRAGAARRLKPVSGRVLGHTTMLPSSWKASLLWPSGDARVWPGLRESPAASEVRAYAARSTSGCK